MRLEWSCFLLDIALTSDPHMRMWAIAGVVNASCTIPLMAQHRGSCAVRDGKV